VIVEELDDIRWDWEEDGRLVRRELDRRTFARGGWATVLFLYEELDASVDRWKPARVAIVRFQKVRGLWKKHAAWNLDGEQEAREVIGALSAWFQSSSSSGSASS
jgi:hypothetical protein